MKFEPATCVILQTFNRLEDLLAVSRRNDPTKWGIPGGKVEAHETNLDCAIREVVEETGLMLMPYRLHPIYSGPCYGADGRDFWVTTYLYESTLNSKWVAEDGFHLKEMHIDELCEEGVSPFAHYNRHVRQAWRAFKR